MGNEESIIKFKNALNDFTNWINGAKLLGVDVNHPPLSKSDQVLLAENFKELFEDFFKEKSNSSFFSSTNTWYKNVIKGLKKMDGNKAICNIVKNGICASIKSFLSKKKSEFLKIFKNGEKLKFPINTTSKGIIKQCEAEIKSLIDKVSKIDEKPDYSIKNILEISENMWD